jgi:hypothetical protein
MRHRKAESATGEPAALMETRGAGMKHLLWRLTVAYTAEYSFQGHCLPLFGYKGETISYTSVFVSWCSFGRLGMCKTTRP